MNLLRSICCLFGSRCAPEEAKSARDTMRAEQSVPADLGQEEADLEKTGKEQMSHMEGGGATLDQKAALTCSVAEAPPLPLVTHNGNHAEPARLGVANPNPRS